MAPIASQTSPVAAVTRPPPESTDAVKDEALIATRKARAAQPGGKQYDENAPEQEVSVMVNNGDHGGFRAIGRFFPTGLTTGVRVTDDELAELKAEPKEIIRVVDAAEVAKAQGKSAPGSSAPALSEDEQKVLQDFRSSGLDAATYLAPASKTGSAPSSSESSATPSSKASSEEPPKRK